MSLPAYVSFNPPVIAHRGAAALAPENTMAAFEAARRAGVKWIETDVKLSQDGVPILFHDDNLERTTDGKGAVALTDWEQLRTLDAGGWRDPAFKGEPIPLLSDLLVMIRDHDLLLNLELKPCMGRAQATTMVALMEIAKIWRRRDAPVLLSSFDLDALLVAKQLHPEWPRGLLLENWVEHWPDLVARVGAQTIHLNADDLTEARVAILNAAGLPVLAYTVNAVPRAQELLRWGVTAVFSDDPGQMIAGLKG